MIFKKTLYKETRNNTPCFFILFKKSNFDPSKSVYVKYLKTN